MMPRLIIRPAVVRDMESIADYLARRNIDAADRFLDACRLEFNRLAEMPGVGRIRDFLSPRLNDVRSWPIGGFRRYLIFYRPIEGGAEILHVVHGARDLDEFFAAP